MDKAMTVVSGVDTTPRTYFLDTSALADGTRLDIKLQGDFSSRGGFSSLLGIGHVIIGLDTSAPEQTVTLTLAAPDMLTRNFNLTFFPSSSSAVASLQLTVSAEEPPGVLAALKVALIVFVCLIGGALLLALIALFVYTPTRT